MKKMLLCSIFIMSMICSCSNKSSAGNAETPNQTEHITSENSDMEYQEIDMFENVEVVNCLDFKYTRFMNYVEGEMHNVYPIYGFVDAAKNPYFREYWRECNPEANEEEIDQCLENRCIYDINDDKSSITAEEQRICVDFVLDSKKITDLDDEKFHEFLENHKYKIKSLSKEYIIKPSEYESEILNEKMYTDQVDNDVDNIITNEISNNEKLSGYQIYQKYLLLPNDDYSFTDKIDPSVSFDGYMVDGLNLCQLSKTTNCMSGMSVILKDTNSDTYVVMRIKIIISNGQVIDSNILYGINTQINESEFGYYSSVEECKEHLIDWTAPDWRKTVLVSK